MEHPTPALPYEPPTVHRLGTLAEVTLGHASSYDDGFAGNHGFSIPP